MTRQLIKLNLSRTSFILKWYWIQLIYRWSSHFSSILLPTQYTAFYFDWLSQLWSVESGNKIKLTIESSEYLKYSFSCISWMPPRLINELFKNSKTIVNSDTDTGRDEQPIPYLRHLFPPVISVFTIWRQSSWAVAGCDYCWTQIHCVTTGSGNFKLMFAEGNKLIVESSEYQQFVFLISCSNAEFIQVKVMNVNIEP